MSVDNSELGPVKAWIEPDRWALLRAFPGRALLLFASASAAGALGYTVHPAFFVLTALCLLRHAAAEASLRELFRDGMLHPALVLEGARGLIATLVRLDENGQTQDAVVISRMPRRWTGSAPPWGGARAAMVIAGDPPNLRPLSPDFAVPDPTLARRAAARIPDVQWRALSRALSQLTHLREGVHPVELGTETWYGSVCALEVDGSLPPHLDVSKQHAWCAGFPAVEEPELAVEEQRRVRKLRSATRLRALLAALATLVLVALVLLAPGSDEGRRTVLAALLLAAPLALLQLVRVIKRVRAYGRDLSEAKLWRFAGALSSFDSLGLDRDLARLVSRRILLPEPGVPQDFVVLKHANELLHANGSWAPTQVKVHVGRVAPPPEGAVKLMLPQELRPSSSGLLDVARRRLTTPEREELEGHAERMRKPGSALLLLTPLAYGVLFIWGQHDWKLPDHLASAPLILGMWVIAAQTAWRRARFAARLRTDAELGWVVTVDHGRASRIDDPELPAQGVETLLHARLDWTVNRRPATWRRHG
jgi:hypothetical protein